MFSKSNKAKQAFTLVEIGVVIVIIGILLSSVLVSRAVVENAKVNAVIAEYRYMYNAIQAHSDAEGCKPGACGGDNTTANSNAEDSFYANLPGFSQTVASKCSPSHSDNAVTNWKVAYRVATPALRTCAFAGLYVKGYLNDKGMNGFNVKKDGTYVVEADLGKSAVGFNFPAAKFSTSAGWDLRAPYGKSTPYVPYEAASGETDLLFTSLILRSATATSDVVRDANTLGIIPPKMAAKIDSKIDDGSPVRGNVVAGNSSNATASKEDCLLRQGGLEIDLTTYAAPTSETAGVTAPSTVHVYGKMSGVTAKSCVMAFKLKDIE